MAQMYSPQSFCDRRLIHHHLGCIKMCTLFMCKYKCLFNSEPSFSNLHWDLLLMIIDWIKMISVICGWWLTNLKLFIYTVYGKVDSHVILCIYNRKWHNWCMGELNILFLWSILAKKHGDIKFCNSLQINLI